MLDFEVLGKLLTRDYSLTTILVWFELECIRLSCTH